MKGDLTKGPVMSSMLLFAVPMILGNLLQQCYNIADTLIVGQFLGSGALAAVGSAFTLMTFLTSILLGLCMGSGAVFSIRSGRKDIYLMDAYEDVEKDKKTGNYNPLIFLQETGEFEETVEKILLMMTAEASRAFEKLPILENVDILRNILYAGIWTKYEMLKRKRESEDEEKKH